LRIEFFGLPLAALLLLADGHEVTLAVLSHRCALGERRLLRQLGRARVLVRGESSPELTERLRREPPPDLVVSWFFPAKLDPSIVVRARMGGIGVHPSLLPRHRGPDPYFAAIDQGDTVTGVTVHRIASEYDTGAMLGSRALAIDPEWTAWQLARKLDRPSLQLLRDTVLRLARGEVLSEQEQDESLASWAKAPSACDCALVWSSSTAAILRRIRALAPAPGAFTEIHGHLLTILRARGARAYPRALEPGEASVVDGTAVVRTGDGAIELLAGEIDDLPFDRAALATLVAQGRELV
jgi:methionyl-tRNA formyltransferase